MTSDRDAAVHLTPREAEIAECVARGWSNKRIAKHLGIEPSTVKTYIERLVRRVPGEGGSRYRIVAWWFGRAA